ncbi:hypothetical protein PS2_018950 [Malus domestica]
MCGCAANQAMGGADQADVWHRVDSELGEVVLRLLELDVAEEELGVGKGRRVLVVLEVKLRLVVELRSIEEDKDPVGSRGFDGGEEFGEETIVKVDHPRIGSRLEGEEFGDRVGFG